MPTLFERLQQQLDTAKNTWAGKDYLQLDSKWINSDINLFKKLIQFDDGWIPEEFASNYNKLLGGFDDFLTVTGEIARIPFVALNSLQFINGVNLAYYSKTYSETMALAGRVLHHSKNSQVTRNSFNYYSQTYDAFFSNFKIQNLANQKNFLMVPEIIGSTDINGKTIYNVLPFKNEPNIGDIYLFFSKVSSLSLEFIKPNLIKPEIKNEFLVASAGPVMPLFTATLEPTPIASVLGQVSSGIVMKCLGVNGEICARYMAGHLFRQTSSLVAPAFELGGKTILNAGVWTALMPYLGVIIAVVILIIIIIKIMENDDNELNLLGDIWLFDEKQYLQTIFAEISGSKDDVKEALTEYLRQYSHLSSPKLFLLDDENDPVLALNGAGEIPKELIASELKRLMTLHDLSINEQGIWTRGAGEFFDDNYLEGL